MNYENLLIEAQNAGTIVKEVNLISKDGFCAGNRIAINRDLITNAEKSCVLIEELGHYHKTVGDITDQSKVTNRKQELIARRWGYERLVSFYDLIEAHKHGCSNRYEVANYLNVTEKFLEEVIEYYAQKHGLYYQIDNYYIILNNGLKILEKF